MNLIDIEKYNYTGGQSSFDRICGSEPKELNIDSALELARHLAKDIDGCAFVDIAINNKFEIDSNYKTAKRSRQLLSAIPSFRRYRRINRDVNDAFILLKQGKNPENRYLDIITGLKKEISTSPIEASKEQCVFYGTGVCQDLIIGKTFEIPYFLSTTLSLTIAINHAIRKSAGPGPNYNPVLRPTVFAIKLSENTRTIFAPSGQPKEHELLFDTGAKLCITQPHILTIGKFDYIECTLVSMDPPMNLV